MKFTNKLNLPKPFVNAVDYFERGYKKSSLKDSISTTTLIKPPQIVELLKRHEADVEIDISDRLFALQGQILHEILEKAADKDASVENRVAAEVLGWTVAGKYDLVEGKKLIDYKYTSVWQYVYGNEEWEKQANINRYLLHKNGVEIDTLENVLMFRDFKLSEIGRGRYPTQAVVVQKLSLWSLEATEEYIKERVKLFQWARQLKDAELMSCTDTERWVNKKSGKPRRCKDYCDVSKFCHQYKNNGGK